MFLYAWDRFPEGQAVEIDAADGPELLDLFAKILTSNARRMLRRGIDRTYLPIVDVSAHPRGRFLLSDTIKTASIARGMAYFSTDELSVDNPQNRIIKAALRMLGTSEQVDASLAHQCLLVGQQMAGVSDMRLSTDLFRRLQLSRNNRHYDLVLKICRLLLELALPGEGEKRTRFAEIASDDTRMSTIFEAFLRNFYRTEQSEFSVDSEHVQWDANAAEPYHLRHLPNMRTDVTLRSSQRIIVADAKFYRRTLVSYMGGTEKVRSDHLYQLLAYLRHTVSNGVDVTGLLIYPQTTSEALRLSFTIEDRHVAVRTVDLTQPWLTIRTELLGFISRIDGEHGLQESIA